MRKRSREPVSARNYSEEYYLESCGGAEFFRKYGPEVLKPPLAHSLRRADLKRGMSALDIGCGRGELLHQVRRLGARAVGTDYSAAALKLAAEVSGCPVLCCDAKSLPFPDAAFDRIFFLGIIDHLHDWELEKCFAEMARVLKPGGFVLIHTCTNRLYYKSCTYRLRLALARAGRALGLPLGEPEPPRSEEDERLHVNEHSYGDLERFLGRIGWKASIEPMPNYKHLLRGLYGDPLPEGFPMLPAPRWKSVLQAGLLFRPPLDRLLAREFFARAWPPA